MHHHHDAEEAVFFPSIENVAGVTGIMERSIEQHRAFTPGFEAFDSYSRTCLPKNFDAEKLRGLIDAFAKPLHRHLKDEIETLRGLDKYDSEEIRKAYKKFEKVMMETDNVCSFQCRNEIAVNSPQTVSDRSSGVRNCRSKL